MEECAPLRSAIQSQAARLLLAYPSDEDRVLPLEDQALADARSQSQAAAQFVQVHEVGRILFIPSPSLCVYVCMCVCLSVRVSVCAPVCVYACACVCMYVCMCVPVCISVCACVCVHVCDARGQGNFIRWV